MPGLQTLVRLRSRSAGARGEVDVRALERKLRRRLSGEVRFDAGSRALYSTDASNYRQVPIGVVVPRTVHDVIETVACARELGAPIVARGGGTSLAGQCCNVALVIDCSKYLNRILELNYEERWARVEPGLVLDTLRNAAEKRHLTFAPDPSTHNHCTLGGMIGNNSCGVHSVMGGMTADNLLELEVALYDGRRLTLRRDPDARGEIHDALRALVDRHEQRIRSGFPQIPRRVSGYNLPALLPEYGFDVARAFCGSEGTLGMILSAKVRLVHSPPERALLVLGYPDVYQTADHVPEVMRSGCIGC